MARLPFANCAAAVARQLQVWVRSAGRRRDGRLAVAAAHAALAAIAFHAGGEAIAAHHAAAALEHADSCDDQVFDQLSSCEAAFT